MLWTENLQDPLVVHRKLTGGIGKGINRGIGINKNLSIHYLYYEVFNVIIEDRVMDGAGNRVREGSVIGTRPQVGSKPRLEG